jgi:sugar phosphate isomerase/epimerase
MKMGIIQGRLSTPTNGFQECPSNWRREFELLKELRLNHVEWIVTKNSFKSNPIFSEDVSGYSINSICADNIVDSRIIQRDFFFENLEPICVAALKNAIKNVTIPLLEDSDVKDNFRRKLFCGLMRELAQKYPQLTFSIEAELEPSKLLELLELGDNILVTYDTGNITSCGIDHEDYIRIFKEKISNVHLKDRTFSAKTVEPGTGDTDFNLIFKNLVSSGYDGVFTLQTAREEYGQEVKTITKHKQLFEEIYNECA